MFSAAFLGQFVYCTTMFVVVVSCSIPIINLCYYFCSFIGLSNKVNSVTKLKIIMLNIINKSRIAFFNELIKLDCFIWFETSDFTISKIVCLKCYWINNDSFKSSQADVKIKQMTEFSLFESIQDMKYLNDS